MTRAVALLLFAGLLLRLFFLWRYAFLASDSLLYQDIALNWLHAHIYGLSTDIPPRPTLIRLPGYPAVLAACSWIFDRWLHPDAGTLRGFLPVLWLQVLADLVTCWLVGDLVYRLWGSRRPATAALALACLCPFTANYAAAALTETFTLFFMTLAFWSLRRWSETRAFRWLAWIGAAMACSILLRPDQGLLAAAVLAALFAYNGGQPHMAARLSPVLVCGLLTALPFVPWTIRNDRTFGVFQPLAPKLANDPGEVPPIGFQRWFRTWAIDFDASEDAYWKYPEETVLMQDLPPQTFDTPAQRERTAGLLQRAAVTPRLNAQVEKEFDQLAAERIAAHPLRYYVLLPVARVADMLTHPRIEMLPVEEHWWQYRLHPAQTLFAFAFAALNLAYAALALAGLPSALRADRTLALSMCGYIVLRCALLLTIDNAEQRYTLEFFPLWIVFAGGLFARKSAA